MLPLSTSSMEAVLSFKFSRLERRMENTDAASVELTTAPSSMLSQKAKCRTQKQNRPVRSAVSSTPSVESSTDLTLSLIHI